MKSGSGQPGSSSSGASNPRHKTGRRFEGAVSDRAQTGFSARQNGQGGDTDISALFAVASEGASEENALQEEFLPGENSSGETPSKGASSRRGEGMGSVRTHPVVQEFAGAQQDMSALLVPPHWLRLNPHNMRQQMTEDGIAEMVESVKAHGVLEPILVTRLPETEDGHPLFQNTAGDRRLIAAGIAKLELVPIRIKEESERVLRRLNFVENRLRENPDIMDFARALMQLRLDLQEEFDEMYGFVEDKGKRVPVRAVTWSDVQQVVGLSSRSVMQLASFARLPKPVQDFASKEEFSSRQARALVLLQGNVEMQLELCRVIKEEELRGDAALARARRMLGGKMRRAGRRALDDFGNPIEIVRVDGHTEIEESVAEYNIDQIITFGDEAALLAPTQNDAQTEAPTSGAGASNKGFVSMEQSAQWARDALQEEQEEKNLLQGADVQGAGTQGADAQGAGAASTQDVSQAQGAPGEEPDGKQGGENSPTLSPSSSTGVPSSSSGSSLGAPPRIVRAPGSWDEAVSGGHQDGADRALKVQGVLENWSRYAATFAEMALELETWDEREFPLSSGDKDDLFRDVRTIQLRAKSLMEGQLLRVKAQV